MSKFIEWFKRLLRIVRDHDVQLSAANDRIRELEALWRERTEVGLDYRSHANLT